MTAPRGPDTTRDEDGLLATTEKAGGRIYVGSLLAEVSRVTGKEIPVLVAAMWDLVESGELNYGTDAHVTTTARDEGAFVLCCDSGADVWPDACPEHGDDNRRPARRADPARDTTTHRNEGRDDRA